MPTRLLAPLLALLAAALPAAARAQLLLPTGPDGAPLTVRHARFEIEADTQVARSRLVQVFENGTDRPLDGHFLLGLPDRAAVSGFATWVDGARVESRVEARAEAEARHARAAARGEASSLLDRLGPAVFRARVANLQPRGTRRTEVEWSELLPYQDGEVTLRVPLRLPELDPPRFRRLEVEVSLRERAKDIGRVWSTTHSVRIDRRGPGHVVVRLEGRDVSPETDLVLRYEVRGDTLGFAFLAHRPDPDAPGSFLVSVAPQELTGVEDIVRKDIAFVFDTSGSMAGAKIEQARAALHRCLGLLNGGDAFTVIAFSDGLDPWRSAVVPATPENLDGARRFVDGLTDGGGTDIGSALRAGLAALEDRGRPRVILFFTDGEPTVGETRPERILSDVQARNVDGTRIFAFGVEAAVNRDLLDRLARDNRGVSAYVAQGQAIDEVVGGFYRTISRPVLADLRFDWGPATVAHPYPAVLPDLYKGQQLLVVGRYRGAGTGRVVLTGTVNGEPRRFEIPVTFPEEAPGDAVVERLWAQRRVGFLLDEIRLSGERPEMRDEVVRLARAHHLVTPYTSLITDPRPQVARLTPGRIKPGDPEVVVPAPADARSVTVHLPFARVHRARWNARRGAWVARFLVPFDAADGVYPVRIVVVHADGRSERLALSVTVDTRAPVLAVDLSGPVVPGELVRLRARPQVGLGQVVRAVASAGGAGAAVELAKSFGDVKQVTAVLWDGREIELGLSPRGGWTAEVETPRDLGRGEWPIVVTAVDWAGNLHRQTVRLAVARDG